jgi:hypothetical protein
MVQARCFAGPRNQDLGHMAPGRTLVLLEDRRRHRLHEQGIAIAARRAAR